jgi:uncharacterized surface protein with fasciclin (FAS1) repeats
MTRIRTTLVLAAALVAIAVVAPAGANTSARSDANIVETAVAAGKFKTLTSLVKKAGLAKTLQGKGPYTVFAPTDAAFAKVPKATLDALARTRRSCARCCSTTWPRAS